MCVYRASIASRTPAGCAFSGLRLCPLLAFCHLSRNCILGGLHCPRLSRPSRASPKDKKKGGLVCAVPRSSPGWLSRGFTRNMQAARERRCNGMVHTLSPASLPAGAITRRTQELNGVDADMAIRIAALTKVAFKGKLPPQPPSNYLDTTIPFILTFLCLSLFPPLLPHHQNCYKSSRHPQNSPGTLDDAANYAPCHTQSWKPL